MKIEAKLWHLEGQLGLNTIWPSGPSLISNMTHIETWSRYYQGDHSEQVWWRLDQNCSLLPLDCSQGFSMIWPTDLVFVLTWPIFKLDPDIVTMIILSKFDEDWVKTVFTRFFNDLTHCPSFWPDMTHIQTWPRYSQDDHSDQVLIKTGPKLRPLVCLQGFFIIWSGDLLFDPTWLSFKLDQDLSKMRVTVIIIGDYIGSATEAGFPTAFGKIAGGKYDLIYSKSRINHDNQDFKRRISKNNFIRKSAVKVFK